MEAESSDVLIVGGGPSGLIAALLAAKRRKVLLLEKSGKNPAFGKRILVSGNGRANFFNADLLFEEAYSSFLAPCKDIVFSDGHNYAEEFLNYLKGELSFPVHREGKLFYPYFLRSECLLNTLLQAIERNGNITTAFLTLDGIDEKKKLVTGLDANGKRKSYSYQDLVLALGGRSLDREDYQNGFLSLFPSFPFVPALCPVRVKEKIPSYLVKNRLRGHLTLKEGDKVLYEEEGELLFKKDGISGICVFDSTIALLDAKRTHPKGTYFYEFTYLDQECSFSALPQFLRRYLSETKTKPGMFRFTFDGLYPFAESQISYGGIRLDTINPKTMEAKAFPHIYLAGEMLDQNFPCGGYNMGMAFLEGYKIGRRLSDEI